VEELVAVLRARQDELVEEGVRRIRTEIPAYARVEDPAFVEDVHRHVAAHHEQLVRSLARGRPLERDEMTFMRPTVNRRVGRIPLTAFMRGFRTYLEVIWDAVLETAVDEPSRVDALTAVGVVLRYINVATTEAAEVYLESERLQSAHGEGLRRDLMEDLLAGVAPAPGPKLAAARTAGIADVPVAVVVAALMAGDDHALRAAASAIARACAAAVEPLTVVRQGEAVCVTPVLEPTLAATQARLAGDGIVLAIGVSGSFPLSGVPDAYSEASAAVEKLRPVGGVLAVGSLSAFDCLAMFGSEAARRRTPRAIREFVASDRADGGVLITTLREYVAADFNVKSAAARLFVHPNTARYRLAKIEERTGLDLRSFTSVQELLIAVRTEELAAP
jgi:PucR C-terminal helix-turn-helix domain